MLCMYNLRKKINESKKKMQFVLSWQVFTVPADNRFSFCMFYCKWSNNTKSFSFYILYCKWSNNTKSLVFVCFIVNGLINTKSLVFVFIIVNGLIIQRVRFLYILL